MGFDIIHIELHSNVVETIEAVEDRPITEISDELIDEHKKKMTYYTDLKTTDYEVIYNDDE